MSVKIEVRELRENEYALTVECDDEEVRARFQDRGFDGNGYTWQGLVESAIRFVGDGQGNRVSHTPEADSAMALSSDRRLLEAVAERLRRAFADESVMDQLVENADSKFLE